MGFKLTENQEKIVNHIQGNLLVAAGAGSGKTAVLTQHIAKRVLDEEKPVDVDQMLVLTYTKAAAAEMKGRIREQLEKRLEEDPDNTELRRQLTLLPTALVCTIDSFCQRVLKEQFFKLELDPGFKVADETELELLKIDIIKEYFEELYATKDPDFMILVDKFGRVKGDDEIVNSVKNIIRIACAEPDPAEWMQRNIGRCDTSWCRYVIERKQKQLKGYLDRYQRLLKLAVEEHFPTADIDCFSQDIIAIKTIADYEGYSFDMLSRLYSQLSFGTYKKKKPKNGGPEWDNPNIETFGKIRDDIKAKIKKLQDSCSEYPEAIIREEEEKQQEDVDRLLRLALEVYSRFQAAKAKENQVDFADMEQMTWKLFRKDGKPTETAVEYSKRFAEILIDEYQDCNKVQEEILEAIARQDVPNRFMVGDVKQSIYGFRKARPDIFVDKYNNYKKQENSYDTLIELRENFRSSVGVINGINMMFSHMMISEMGDIDYAKDGCLNPDKSKIGEKPDIEIHVLETQKQEGEHFLDAFSDIEKEAYYVASRIRTMVLEKTPVIDRETGEKRPMRYGDVAILLRSVSKLAPVFVNALKEFGISGYSESESGYYDSLEVANTLDFLAVIDNPYQDVKLVGVLKSGYCDFSSDELAAVHLLGKANGLVWLYDSVRLLAGLDTDEAKSSSISYETVKKAESFINIYDRMRERSAYLTISELITELLDETGFMYYSLALPGGKKRVQNLRMLQVKAEAYEQTRYRGIFQFLRYVDQLKAYEMDIDTPSIQTDEDSVVIMTIHKSKGLEFPVCFLCGATKGFSNMESKNKIQQDDIYGIGMDIINDKYRYKLASFKKACILDKKKLNQKTEEQRLLYVAMTRARDRLIVTGGVAGAHDYFKSMSATLSKGEKLALADVSEAKNYLEWIALAVVQEELSCQDSELSALSFVDECILENNDYSIKTEINYYQDIELPENIEVIKAQTAQVPISEEISRVLDRSYSYESERGIHAIYTVSELKKTAYVSPDGEHPELGDKGKKKAVSKTGGLSGADRGNAYHHFMEVLDFGAFEALNDSQAEELAVKKLDERLADNTLNSAERSCIDALDIVTLLKSDIGRRMIRADMRGELLREQEFVYALAPGDIAELNASGDIDEQVLIQGIIDAVFYEDGKWIIIDYKTDNMQTDEEFVNRYKIQLKYYKGAWEDIKGEQVSEGYLYSFRLGRFIKVF